MKREFARKNQGRKPLKMTVLMVFMLLVLLSACGKKSETTVNDIYNRDYSLQQGTVAHYYSIDEARDYINTWYSYTLGDDYEIYKNEDGDFRCYLELEPLDYTYVTIKGGLKFYVGFDDASNDWGVPYIEEAIDYEWKIPTGNFYAETYSKNRYTGEVSSPYYVYLNIIGFDGEKLHAVLEATYDSTTGEIGSYGSCDQTKTMRLLDSGNTFDPVISFPLDGGYPQFYLCVTKDSISLYENMNADFACELMPVEGSKSPASDNNNNKTQTGPSEKDMAGCDSRVVIPDSGSWLADYETKTVDAEYDVRIVVRYMLISDFDYEGYNNLGYAYEGEKVTELARQDGFSLIETSDGLIGWVKSSLLK